MLHPRAYFAASATRLLSDSGPRGQREGGPSPEHLGIEGLDGRERVERLICDDGEREPAMRRGLAGFVLSRLSRLKRGSSWP